MDNETKNYIDETIRQHFNAFRKDISTKLNSFINKAKPAVSQQRESNTFFFLALEFLINENSQRSKSFLEYIESVALSEKFDESSKQLARTWLNSDAYSDNDKAKRYDGFSPSQAILRVIQGGFGKADPDKKK